MDYSTQSIKSNNVTMNSHMDYSSLSARSNNGTIHSLDTSMNYSRSNNYSQSYLDSSPLKFSNYGGSISGVTDYTKYANDLSML